LVIPGIRFGLPSLETATAAVDAVVRPDGSEPIRLRCTHVVGPYGPVWNSVFFSRLQGTPIWGVANRGDQTRDLYSLSHFKEPRICLWKAHMEEARDMMNPSGLHVIDQSASMWVMAP